MDQLKPLPANSSPLTPLSFLDRAAVVYADCLSVIYNDTSYTWSQTHRRCLQLASAIVSIGIKPGQVVSIVAPNVPAMYEVHFAVPMAGAVLSNINTRLDAHAVSVLLQHSESKLVFVDIASREVVLEALSLFPLHVHRPILILLTDDSVESPQPISTVQFHDTYEGLLTKGNSEFEWVRPNSEWDPIVINYTSGTTSLPKGVVHCHRGVFIMSLDSLIDWSVPKQPVYLWTLPMFHSNGWTFTWGMAAIGGVNVCVRKINEATIYRLIEDHNVTHFCAAPVVLHMLANSHQRAEPFKSPVYVLTGGSSPPASILLKAESLGFVVSHGYGMTEASGVIISCAWKSQWNQFPALERARLKARQGVRTIGMTEVDVVDTETGASVRRDGLSMGEIVVRGSSVMLGYLKDPVSTSKCMRDDGWLYTGDVGVMHPDGYLEIKDRMKDVIISGGENVSSVEVEAVLCSHPEVKEAAVVARPDEFWGETPCAFVSLNGYGLQKKAKVEEIIEHCRRKLPHYMVPKTLVLKEDLPKTPTGKLQKFVLREIAKSMGSLTVSRM